VVAWWVAPLSLTATKKLWDHSTISLEKYNSGRWITRLVCRWRAQPTVWTNVNCRTPWTSTSWTHIAALGLPLATSVRVSADYLSSHILYKWWLEVLLSSLIGVAVDPEREAARSLRWLISADQLLTLLVISSGMHASIHATRLTRRMWQVVCVSVTVRVAHNKNDDNNNDDACDRRWQLRRRLVVPCDWKRWVLNLMIERVYSDPLKWQSPN